MPEPVPLRQSIRTFIVRVLTGFGFLFGVGWFLREDLLVLLRRPIEPYLRSNEVDLSLYSVLDRMMVHFSIALRFSLLLTIPLLVVMIWRRIAPRLSKRTRRAGWGWLSLILLLFLGGVVAGWGVFMPSLYGFIVRYSLEDTGLIFGSGMGKTGAMILDLSDYVSLSTMFLLGSGLLFLLPVAMASLCHIGLIESSSYARYRGSVLVVLLIVASVLTPPDIILMILFGALLYGVFEFGLLLSYLVDPERRRRAAGS